MTAPTLVTEPRRRLHPLSPLLRGFRALVLVVAAASWQGYAQLGAREWALGVCALMVLILVGSVLSWAVTGYHVVGRELRIYEGLVFRRTRSIPLERLQSVEVVRTVTARVLGLAELRLEVVGAHRTEARLAFLTVEQATALRAHLLAISGTARAVLAPAPTEIPAGSLAPSPTGLLPGSPAGSPDGPAVGMPAGPPERVLHRVAGSSLIVSQLLRPQWWLLPLAVFYPVFVFAQTHDLGFVAVASTLTAIGGAVAAPVRVVLGEWAFTLASAPDGLRLRRGLTETRAQTVPAGRIQRLVIEWPLLWRMLGWVRVGMDVAGVHVREHEQLAGGGSLLPVGTVPVAEHLLAEAVPGFWLRATVIAKVPARAHWLVPLRGFVLGYQLAPTAFCARGGLLRRHLTVIPYARVQSVRVTQNLRQRLLRLADVWVDAAGAQATAVAAHRDVREARALALHLADLSRAARHAPAYPLPHQR